MSLAWICLLISVLLNIAAQYSLRAGMRNFAPAATQPIVTTIKSFILNPGLIIGASFFLLSMFFYSYSLSKIKLSMAYPVFTSGIIIGVTLLSYFLLKESIRPIQMVGIALVMVGVWCVAAFAR